MRLEDGHEDSVLSMDSTPPSPSQSEVSATESVLTSPRRFKARVCVGSLRVEILPLFNDTSLLSNNGPVTNTIFIA